MLDPLRIEQVLTNLLDNAIKYSPDGGQIHISLSREADNVRLSVRDHGVGVPVEHRGHIFDRFYQAHAGGPLTSMAGMGLGLYISRQIVELHGGSIDAEFPDDGGTRLVVSLPVISE
jgi:signal transduction histidine kinase